MTAALQNPWLNFSAAIPFPAEQEVAALTQPPSAAAAPSPAEEDMKEAPADNAGSMPAGATDAREKFRLDVARTLADWRLGTIPPRDDGAVGAIFREGIADIIRLRLRIAYMPLFQGLERIQRRVGILADSKREPWAPARHVVNGVKYAGYRH